MGVLNSVRHKFVSVLKLSLGNGGIQDARCVVSIEAIPKKRWNLGYKMLGVYREDRNGKIPWYFGVRCFMRMLGRAVCYLSWCDFLVCTLNLYWLMFDGTARSVHLSECDTRSRYDVMLQALSNASTGVERKDRPQSPMRVRGAPSRRTTWISRNLAMSGAVALGRAEVLM